MNIYKNYKKIIIIILSILFLSFLFKKNYENFKPITFNEKTTKDIEKNLKDILKGFPNIFSKITHTTLETNKTFNIPSLNIDGQIIDKTQIKTNNLKFQNFNLKTNGTLNTNKLCIGDSCLEKKHIEMLIGNRDFWLKSYKNNKYLRNFNYTHNHKADQSDVRGPNHSHGNLHNTTIKLGMFIGGKGNEEKFRLRL